MHDPIHTTVHDTVPDDTPTRWVTSSYSAGNAQCVETARSSRGRLVRDSKLGEASPVLEFDAAGWQHFTTQISAT